MKRSSVTVSDETKLEAKQLQAVALLASGCPAKDVAAELKVSPQTISTWRKQPAFRNALNNLKIQCLMSARDNLRTLSVDATAELARLMKHGQSERVRLQAALAILRGVGVLDQQYTNNVLWRQLGTV